MERFTVSEHKCSWDDSKWYVVTDNGYPNCPACYDHQQVGINFGSKDRAETVANVLNAEWQEFLIESNPGSC